VQTSLADASEEGTKKRTRKLSEMERALIFIKHHFKFLWRIIEWGNGILFFLIFKSKTEIISQRFYKEFDLHVFSYRKLVSEDIVSLDKLIKSQNPSDLKYFHPHDLDINSLLKQLKKPAFLMMGVFLGEKIVGYFFLRFFINKKCFVGRLIDQDYRGKGIGQIMNSIMYNTAWSMGFRCLSTISFKNESVMRAHSKNPAMVVLKELQNDYLLVEFLNNHTSTDSTSGS
jgi:hypothetical protein